MHFSVLILNRISHSPHCFFLNSHSCYQILFNCQHLLKLFFITRAFLEAQLVKNLPAMQETQVWSLGQEDPLEKKIATHTSILAWRIPWTEEPGKLWSIGSQRVRRDLDRLSHFQPPSYSEFNYFLINTTLCILVILQHVNHTLIICFYVLFVIHNPTVLVSLGNCLNLGFST